MSTTKKVALVTGGARGIGRAVAERLARDGFAVAVADRAPAAETVSAIKAGGGDAIGVEMDVTDPDSVAAAIENVTKNLGPAAVLVNNAGLHANPMVNVKDMDFKDWRKIMSVNLDGAFLVTKAVLANMIDSGWGRVINMGSASVNAFTPPGMAHYTASKAGLVGLTRALATDLGEYGITCNLVAPTGVMTPGIEEIAGGVDLSDVVIASQAIKEVAKAEDVAGAVSFLASNDSRMVTAQTLFVDGGAVRAG